MKATSIDLFAPLVPKERWHPNFLRAHESASDAERATLREWSSGFLDRDGKFVKEFQTTFNSSFWELYLHALFAACGCVRNQSVTAPDFVITSGPFGAMVAEAVTAQNPADLSPEWAAKLDETFWARDREAVLDLACLRLAQAIAAKHKKWEDSYSRLSHCQALPYLICVAPFEQPWASQQGTEAIDRVLFMGPRQIVAGGGALATTVTDAAFKPSGATVPLGLFTDERMSAVSAIIFSSLATWSKVRAMSGVGKHTAVFFGSRLTHNGFEQFCAPAGEYQEFIADGAHLFVNPFARIPVDPEPFLEAGLCVHEPRPEATRTWFGPRGSLISRVAFEMRTTDPVLPYQTAALPSHEPASPPDGVPFAGPSSNATTDSITLELYRGWTLYVGRDTTDGDWAVLAKRFTATSLAMFVSFEACASGEFLTPFFATREAAVKFAKRQIDEQDQVSKTQY